MTKPIQIFHGDTPAEARKRHEDIIKRLEELGPEQVKAREFPTQWAPIIGAWLNGDKLEPDKKPDDPKPPDSGED
jgi:hypothetical protein